MTTVALLVPALNAAETLPALMKSAEVQRPRFDEIICFDDGSTDSTAEVAAKWGATVISSKRNLGAGAARNRLAVAASSDWLHFHDADDLLAPEHNAQVWERMTTNSDVIVCGSIWVDELSREKVIEWRYRDEDLVADAVAANLANPIGGISATIRKATFDSIGGFDEEHSCWEDADLHVRLAATGARYRAIESSLTTAIRRSGSVSSDQDYCLACRLDYLRGYPDLLGADYYEAIGSEAELVMERAFCARQSNIARGAYLLAHQLGKSPPRTNNPLIKAIGLIAPLHACAIQARWRHHQQQGTR